MHAVPWKQIEARGLSYPFNLPWDDVTVSRHGMVLDAVAWAQCEAR
jgi:hypothetical protein